MRPERLLRNWKSSLPLNAGKAGGSTVFRRLGVQVLAGDDEVYTIGFYNAEMKTNTSRLLGPLAGAQAMVTDGAQAWSPGRAMFLPISFAGLATKTKADAAVVFPDGTVHLTPLDGNYAVREAQKQVVQFNAMAGAARPRLLRRPGATLPSGCGNSKNSWTLACSLRMSTRPSEPRSSTRSSFSTVPTTSSV